MSGRILLGHGSGGKLYRDLVRDVFVAAFANPVLERLDDAAVLATGGRVAFTTDAHVVQPLRFPGGDIGRLAVAGTVNDLATAGARPLALSAAFVIEEGFALADLEAVCASMARTAREAGVAIVTGDTKVVERGAADGLFIITTGLGEIVVEHEITAGGGARGRRRPAQRHHRRPRAGGACGARRVPLHGHVESDCAPLWELVLPPCRQAGRRCASCATRLGAAWPPCSPSWPRPPAWASRSRKRTIPVSRAVRAACDLLGYDPLTLANEGKMVLVVGPGCAEAVLEALRGRPEGARAARIGAVTRAHPGRVVLETALGTRRVLDMPVGELLPRIC